MPRRRLGDVISITTHAVTHNLSENIGSATLGKLQVFEDQNACAFADYKSIARCVPGAAGLLRLVIARGKRAHGREPAYAHRSDRRFRTSGDHDLGIAPLNDLEGI